MSNLVIDIGNTRVKWGVFERERMTSSGVSAEDDMADLDFDGCDRIIVSSVRETQQYGFSDKKTLYFDHQTPVPLQLDYQTPETLGLDRIAGAVGVYQEFPITDCLLIDAGTCVTYDLITKQGLFKGGSIAPGLQMRLQAMHQFTGRLPEVKLTGEDEISYPAKSTVENMKTGAYNGILHEIEGYISSLKEDFPDLCVILSGGDASYFESTIKAPIFVRPEIILTGLNRILLHNEIHA